MTKTESIEALLNPSLRVSRPVAACARCRSAKIKCDGKLPACSACERAGKARECSSANDDFAKGKERSYVAALETTVQRLQKQIKEFKDGGAIDQHFQLLGGATSNGRPTLHRRPLSNSRRREASDMDELVSDFGFLTVNATSRDFHGFTSTMSFARLLMGLAIKEPLPLSNDLQLPSRYTITPFIEQYFTNVYVLLPFFSETEFMTSLSKIYQESSPGLPIAPIDYWFVHLVLAISAASTCRSKGDTAYDTAIQNVNAAMKYADYVIHPGSIAGIQALLLLVQYALLDPEHFDAWYLIGMASRLLVDLGLHCEPAPETKISKRALDLRRRVFYCTYALDRQISMSRGFAFSFTDDSAPNVLLPTLATDLEKRSPSQLFLRSIRPSLFLFDIRRVQSSFYQAACFSSRSPWSPSHANDYISSILNDLRTWHSSIPTTFEQRHLQYFFVEFIYSQLLAVSPNPRMPVDGMTDIHKALVFHLAIQFADQMQLIIQHSDSQAYFTYSDICRIQYVGQQFQTVLWSSFDHLLRHQHNLLAGAPVANVSPIENCAKAITFINKSIVVLDFARTRWGLPGLREKFEQETAVLVTRLQNKQQEFQKEGIAMASSTFPTTTQSYENRNPDGLGAAVFNQGQFDPMQSTPQPQLASYLATPPTVHRSNLTGMTWSDGQTNLNLPQGSMPRRSYEFMNSGNG